MWQTDSLGMVPPGFVIKTTAGCTCKHHWTMAQNSLFMTIILLIQNTTTSTLNEIPNVAYIMLNPRLQMVKWLNRAHNMSIGKWQRAPSCEWRALWSQCQHKPMCDNLLCGKLKDNFSHVKTFICHKIWPNFFTYTGRQIEIVTEVVWLKITPVQEAHTAQPTWRLKQNWWNFKKGLASCIAVFLTTFLKFYLQK